MLKTISLATIVAFAATSSFAGSLAAPEEKDDVTFIPAGGSGIGVPAIVGGVLAAVAIGALASSSSDDTTEAAQD